MITIESFLQLSEHARATAIHAATGAEVAALLGACDAHVHESHTMPESPLLYPPPGYRSVHSPKADLEKHRAGLRRWVHEAMRAAEKIASAQARARADEVYRYEMRRWHAR